MLSSCSCSSFLPLTSHWPPHLSSPGKWHKTSQASTIISFSEATRQQDLLNLETLWGTKMIPMGSTLMFFFSLYSKVKELKVFLQNSFPWTPIHLYIITLWDYVARLVLPNLTRKLNLSTEATPRWWPWQNLDKTNQQDPELNVNFENNPDSWVMWLSLVYPTTPVIVGKWQWLDEPIFVAPRICTLPIDC